jgi:hypothetical protein
VPDSAKRVVDPAARPRIAEPENRVPAHTIVLDVDPGTDDALAILYVVQHPGIKVSGISCLAGNASQQQGGDQHTWCSTRPELPRSGGGRVS